MPNLSLSFLVDKHSQADGWFAHVGRIDAMCLPLFAADFHEREIFVAEQSLS